MTEERRIPVDIDTTVGSIIRTLDRLEALSEEELASNGTIASSSRYNN
jgi:hypothetical protein